MIVLLVAGVVAWSLVCVALGCWLGRAASRKERGGYIVPGVPVDKWGGDWAA